MRSVLMIVTALTVTQQVSAETRGGFTLGVEAFDYAYRERQDGATIVRDDGVFGGVALDYIETIGSAAFLRARIRSSWGSVDYRADEDRIEGVNQDIAQVEFHLGRDISIGRATLTPFAGLGGRLLVDNSGGKLSTGGKAGYDREVSYTYVPIGAGLSAPLGKGWRLQTSAQINLLFGGDVRSEFSDVDPELPNVRLDLNGGLGLEASTALAVSLGRREIAFGPFVRHWRLRTSNERVLTDEDGSIAIFEPRNRTTELGVRLSFAF